MDDPTTYRAQNVDPTTTIQNKNNALAKKLYQENCIELSVKKFITTYNSVAPRFYGLPKIHKPNSPLRPVVSFMKAPTYNFSKFLSQILACVSEDRLNVRNSQQLIDKLRNVELEDDDILVSFDAVALFTCIPVALVLEITKERWNNIKNFTSINEKLFFEALEFCLRNGYFTYKNVFYIQVEGVAMGNPLSPIVSEIVLDKLFDTILNTFDVEIFDQICRWQSLCCES